MGLLNFLNPFGGAGGGGGGSMSSGGIGNSSSANSNASNDGRVVGGEYSTNSSTLITGGTNTLSDHGAITGGLQLALAGIEGAHELARQSQAASGGLLTGALQMAGEQQAKFTGAIENIKTADVRTLVITGLAVVGLVGVAIFMRKS